MNHSGLTRLLPLLIGAGLSACSTLVPTERPAIPLPAHYTAENSQTAASATAQHQPRWLANSAPPAEWWRAFSSDALNALVSEGLANNPSLEATRHSLEAARAGLRAQIGKTTLPSVDASVSRVNQRTLNLPGQLPLTYQDSVLNAGVNASWSFNLLGASTLANQALAGQVKEQDWQRLASRRVLANNIVQLAINLALLQAQLDESTRQVELGAFQARQALLRQQTGSLSQAEMLLARQRAAELASSLPEQRARIMQLRHAIAVLLGRNPQAAPQPLSLAQLHLPQELPVSLPSALVQQRPDIMAAEAALNAAAAQVGAARAAWFPTLSLSASYGRGGYDWSTLTSPAGLIWSAGAGLTQPLFNGGALREQQNQAQALYQAAIQQYRQVVLNALRSVADSLATLEENANSLTQTTAASEAAEQAWKQALMRYQLGAVAWDDTLSAEQNYHTAHMRSLQAQAAQLSACANLFDALGERTTP
jgi:NodT family efflux transporter outer membrane factor (OMF) lipoprotein